jgi:hypothetical protein
MRGLRAGACAVDITPRAFPVIVCGSFLERTADAALDPIFVRSLVLDDGRTRIAIAVADVALIPRELADEAKAMACAATGIPVERMVVAATHTHAAPAPTGALGSRPDPAFARALPRGIADAITGAAGRLEPAAIGWGRADAWAHTNCRRWITRPDRRLEDPFGDRTVRATMHPGYQNPDFICPSGPIDPELSLVAIRSLDGRPIAALANYSMHYFGTPAVSADYYGRFAAGLGPRLGADGRFVAMMSQGTSGDLHWMDYGRPKRDGYTIDQYAAEMIEQAARIYEGIRVDDAFDLEMAEARRTIGRRVPDAARLAWAQRVVDEMGDRQPANRTEVYAREQLFLAAEPERELRFQAIRLGDCGIAVTPTEAFGLTGLRLKAASPLTPTFTITLANGAEGYAPPREQHALGGYVTWPARTAGLDAAADEVVTESLLALLERVSGRPRRVPCRPAGRYARYVIDSAPLAYWRLDEFGGPVAVDDSGHDHHASYDGPIAFYLPGASRRTSGDAPERPSPFSGPALSRAPYFAGGRLTATLGRLADRWSVSLWVWPGLADAAGAGTRWLLTRIAGDEGVERLGLSAGDRSLRVCLQSRTDAPAVGAVTLAPKTWHHVVFVRDAGTMRVHVNGRMEPDVALAGAPLAPGATTTLVVGGGRDGEPGFEGQVDEVSVHGAALSADDIATLFRLAEAR